MGFETKTETKILGKEMVLSRVSELDIFESFCPTKFVLNRPFSSPFRKDSNPSCVIHFKNGYYYFVDYGDSTYRGDCFDFVKAMTNAVDFPETLENVNSQMGLNLLSSKPKEVSLRKKEEEAQEEPITDEYKLIQPKIKRFTKRGVQYWGDYHISTKDLKRHKDVKTYQIDRFWIDKKLFYISNDDDLCFGHFFKEKYWKLYRPLADISKGEWKWISNVPLKEMWGLDNLKSGRPGIGAKSVKDYYVLSNIKEEVCGVQNESLAAISEENNNYIKENTSEFYLFYDSDAPGKKASYTVTEEYEYKHLNTPDYLLNFEINDPAAWAKRDSPEAVKYHLKCKNVI